MKKSLVIGVFILFIFMSNVAFAQGSPLTSSSPVVKSSPSQESTFKDPLFLDYSQSINLIFEDIEKALQENRFDDIAGYRKVLDRSLYFIELRDNPLSLYRHSP